MQAGQTPQMESKSRLEREIVIDLRISRDHRTLEGTGKGKRCDVDPTLKEKET